MFHKNDYIIKRKEYNYEKKHIYNRKKHYEQKYENEYNPRAVRVALESAKKYGFDAGNSSTYNNEADAFKHTFASALVSMEEGQTISFLGGWYHEFENSSNSLNEFNMDTNNKIGRQIAGELVKDYAGRWDSLSDHKKEEIIAERVWKCMQSGELIYVHNYECQDGTKVSGYYRSRPSR